MKLRAQVIIASDDDDDDERRSVVHEVAHIDRDALSVDTLGLQLESVSMQFRPPHRVGRRSEAPSTCRTDEWDDADEGLRQFRDQGLLDAGRT